MDCHIQGVAALTVSDLYIIEVASEAGILCRLDGSALRAASSSDSNRACLAGEHERWMCTDWEGTCWLGHTGFQDSSDTESESERRSNESSSCTEEQDDDQSSQTA